jgi:hypothetical protein
MEELNAAKALTSNGQFPGQADAASEARGWQKLRWMRHDANISSESGSSRLHRDEGVILPAR